MLALRKGLNYTIAVYTLQESALSALCPNCAVGSTFLLNSFASLFMINTFLPKELDHGYVMTIFYKIIMYMSNHLPALRFHLLEHRVHQFPKCAS